MCDVGSRCRGLCRWEGERNYGLTRGFCVDRGKGGDERDGMADESDGEV